MVGSNFHKLDPVSLFFLISPWGEGGGGGTALNLLPPVQHTKSFQPGAACFNKPIGMLPPDHTRPLPSCKTKTSTSTSRLFARTTQGLVILKFVTGEQTISRSWTSGVHKIRTVSHLERITEQSDSRREGKERKREAKTASSISSHKFKYIPCLI